MTAHATPRRSAFSGQEQAEAQICLRCPVEHGCNESDPRCPLPDVREKHKPTNDDEPQRAARATLPECPRCWSRQVIKSGFIRDRQRYECKGCDYHFLGAETRQPPPRGGKPAIPACPSCKGRRVIKNGRSGGAQRYLCRGCSFQFAEGKREQTP